MRRRAAMRKFRRRCRLLGVLTLLAALLVALIPVDVFADAGEVVANGTCEGSSVQWSIAKTAEDGKYELTIFGSGTMPAYSRDSVSPWKMAYITETSSGTGGSSGSSASATVGDSSTSSDTASTESSTQTYTQTSIPPSSIVSLKIEEGVTSIGDYAFCDMTGLAGSLTIPGSVTNIGTRAFENTAFNGTLTFTAGSGSLAFGPYSFSGTGFTGSLIIPDRTITIEESAFSGCAGFNGTLTIGSGVTTIKENAFNGCSGFIGSLLIPDSVTSLGQGAFEGCSGFNSTLTIGSGITILEPNVFHGCSAFIGMPSLRAGLTEIRDGAFKECSNLRVSLTIPAAVVNIGNEAFAGSGITALTFEGGAGALTIGERAFYQCANLTGATKFLSNLTTIGKNAFSSTNMEADFSGATNLATIEEGAFSGCNNVGGAITIPANVSTIGIDAFKPSSVMIATFLGGIPANIYGVNTVFPDDTIIFFSTGTAEEWKRKLGDQYIYSGNTGSGDIRVVDNRENKNGTDDFDIEFIGDTNGLGKGVLIVEDIDPDKDEIKGKLSNYNEDRDRYDGFEITYLDEKGGLQPTIPAKCLTTLTVPVSWDVTSSTMDRTSAYSISSGRLETLKYVERGDKVNTVKFNITHLSQFAVVYYGEDTSNNSNSGSSQSSASNSGGSTPGNTGATNSNTNTSSGGGTGNQGSNNASSQGGTNNSGNQSGAGSSSNTVSAQRVERRDDGMDSTAYLADNQTPSGNVALLVDDPINRAAISNIIASDENYTYEEAYPFSLQTIDADTGNPSQDNLSWNVTVEIPDSIVLANGEAKLYRVTGSSLDEIEMTPDRNANAVSFRTTVSGETRDYVLLYKETSKLLVQRLIDQRTDRTDYGSVQRSSFDTLKQPLTTNRYLIITESDGRAIDPMITTTGSYDADKVSFFMLNMRDKAENGNRVTDFGECTISMTLPTEMDPDLGNIQIAWVDSEGELHLEDAELTDSEGITRLTFTTDYMSECAIIYNKSGQAAHRLRILNRTGSINGAITGNVSVSPLPKDWYLIVSDVATSESKIVPLIQADASLKGYKVQGVYEITLMDARQNGNPVVNFGVCRINIPLPDSVDAVNGVLRVVSMEGDALDKSITTGQGMSVDEEEPTVSFYTNHFTEFAVLYAGNPEAVANANASNTGTTNANQSGTQEAQGGTAATSASGASGSGASGASANASGSAASGSSGQGAATGGAGASGSNAGATNAANAGSATTTIVNNGDMPRTGDRSSYKTFIVVMLAILGVIELLISIPPKRRRIV